MYSIKDVQQELARRGYDPGPIDGIMGPLTRKAIIEFQDISGIDVKWPGTVGPKTLEALFPENGDNAAYDIKYPWVDLLLSKKGLHENRDNKELRAWLKSDGHALGDPSKFPWCGDAVETAIGLTLPSEPRLANPYLARNWDRFGQPVPPTFAAVGRFWRGSPTAITGHVGFLVGRNASGSSYYVLGGNQANRISVVPISASRLATTRWPLTAEYPTTIYLPIMKGGKLSLSEA